MTLPSWVPKNSAIPSPTRMLFFINLPKLSAIIAALTGLIHRLLSLPVSFQLLRRSDGQSSISREALPPKPEAPADQFEEWNKLKTQLKKLKTAIAAKKTADAKGLAAGHVQPDR